MSELRNCPFCGGEASSSGKVKYSNRFAREQGWEQCEFYFCNCPVCGVSNQGLRGYNTPAEAIAAWNRRAPSPADPAALRSAVLTEREECAKLADGFTDEEDGDIAYDIAASIRSRTP